MTLIDILWMSFVVVVLLFIETAIEENVKEWRRRRRVDKITRELERNRGIVDKVVKEVLGDNSKREG